MVLIGDRSTQEGLGPYDLSIRASIKALVETILHCALPASHHQHSSSKTKPFPASHHQHSSLKTKPFPASTMKTSTITIPSLFLLAVPLAQARGISCSNTQMGLGCGRNICYAPVHVFTFNNGNYNCRTTGTVAGACNSLTPGNNIWHSVGDSGIKDVGLTCTNVNGYQGKIKRARLEMIDGNWLWATIEDNIGTGSFGCEVKKCAGNFCNYSCSVN